MMSQVESIEQLKTLVTDVRNIHKGFITNFYLDDFKHDVWIRHKDFYYENIGETCFLVKQSHDFWNVFYCSTAMTALQSDLVLLKDRYFGKTMLLDIVGLDAQCVPVLEMLKNLGFEHSISLVRMKRMTEVENYVENGSVIKATTEDVTIIHSLLHQFFDEKTEQIPYLDELEAYIKDGHILICRERSRIVGFLIFEINATTLYLRYWFTHPDYRDNKVGSRLFHKFLEIGKTTRRQLFWVVQTNENAIKRYRHYGFKEENMYDYVMRIN